MSDKKADADIQAAKRYAREEYTAFANSNQKFKGLDAAMHVKYKVPADKPLEYADFKGHKDAETDREKHTAAKQRNDGLMETLREKVGEKYGLSSADLQAAEGPASKDPKDSMNVIKAVVIAAQKNEPVEESLARKSTPPAPQKSNGATR